MQHAPQKLQNFIIIRSQTVKLAQHETTHMQAMWPGRSRFCVLIALNKDSHNHYTETQELPVPMTCFLELFCLLES